MDILNLIREDFIFPNLKVESKEELFQVLYGQLNKKGFVKESYLNGIMEREKKYPTGLQLLQYGCALPHTDLEHVISPAICVATLKNPLTFKSMEDFRNDVMVNIIFMLALNKAEYQIIALQQLAGFLQNNEFIEKIIKSTDAKEIYHLVKGYKKVAV